MIPSPQHPHPFKSYKAYFVPVAFGLLAIAGKYILEAGELPTLTWILRPLAALVGLLTGSAFTYDPALGYVNAAGTVSLGPSCSGINFMIITFMLSLFAFLPRHSTKKQLAYGLLFLLLSWLFSLTVNACRIAVSMRLLEHEEAFPFLGTEKAHEATGVLYFLLSLLLYYFFLKKFISKYAAA